MTARKKPGKKKVGSRPAKVAARPTRRPARALRHDTPVDLPALSLPHDTPVETRRVEQSALAVTNAAPSADQVLARLRRTQTLEAGFELWHELRLQHRAHLAALADERRQLGERGEFLVGAVRAARDGGPAPSQATKALAVPGQGLDGFLADARGKLDRARSAVEQRATLAAASWAQALGAVRAELRDRVRRTLLHVRPKLKMSLRTLGNDRRILHLDRLSGDHAVLVCVLFCQRLPSRYGFLFDDSTDDQHLELPTLYAEEGVTQVRPDAATLKALVTAPGEVVPFKAIVPLLVSDPEGAVQLVRFVERGPVMEAEIEDGRAFRNVLSREEAERIAGVLLRLKLEERIELELAAG